MKSGSIGKLCILKKKNLKNKRKFHAISELNHDLSKSILIYPIFRWGCDSRQTHTGEQLLGMCRWFPQPSQEQRSHLRRTNSLFWRSVLQWPHQNGGIAEQNYSSFKTYWWQLVGVGVLNELSLQKKKHLSKVTKIRWIICAKQMYFQWYSSVCVLMCYLSEVSLQSTEMKWGFKDTSHITCF